MPKVSYKMGTRQSKGGLRSREKRKRLQNDAAKVSSFFVLKPARGLRGKYQMRTMRYVRQNASVCVKQNTSLGMKSLNCVALWQIAWCYHVKQIFELKYTEYTELQQCREQWAIADLHTEVVITLNVKETTRLNMSPVYIDKTVLYFI